MEHLSENQTNDLQKKMNSNSKFLEFQTIRIKPYRIDYRRILPGETLTKKFTIQNVGSAMVFIRVTSTNSQFFKVEPVMARGEHLPPGLKTTRTVKIIGGGGLPEYFALSIFVNEKICEYPIVKMSLSAKVNISPQALHFGIVDCGAMQRILEVLLTNEGARIAAFFVDLSKVNKVVSAEPLKGHVKPGSTVKVMFKVVSFKAMRLDSMVVIKCDATITRIPITAEIILTHLQAVHVNATESFTLIAFPPTYHGLKSTEIFLVKNISAKVKMFCVKAELRDKYIDVDEYREVNPDYDCFQLRPDSGLFIPDEAKIFIITFTPSENRHKDTTQCYFATVLIKAFRCTHLDMTQNVNIFEEPEYIALSRNVSQDTMRSGISEVSFNSLRRIPSSTTRLYSLSGLSSLTSLQDRTDMEDYSHFLEFSENDFVRVHMYGTVEIPGIEIVPDEIVIMEMIVNDRGTRILEIKNKSSKLPIYVRPKKIPFVKVEPYLIFLNPSQSVQASVIITPKNIGIQRNILIFEMLYHDVPKEGDLTTLGEMKVKITYEVVSQMKLPKFVLNTGLSPNYIKEVGKHCDRVKFDTKLDGTSKAITVDVHQQIDATLKDLVAFPNDTQRSIRPWRSKQECKTIFGKRLRYSAPLERNYELTVLEQKYKDEIVAYYNSCMKRKTIEESGIKLAEEYSLTKTSKVMMQDFKCQDAKLVYETKKSSKHFFLPLNPMQMNKIVLWPTAIRTGKVASNHAYTFTLAINNTNDFDIRLLIRSDKPNVFFFEGNRYVIKGNSKIDVRLVYKTLSSGYYNSSLDLIVNESMVLTVPIFAQVITKALQLKTSLVTFEDNVTMKYIELINKLNVKVSFTWVIVHSNFSIEPSMGSVHPTSKMICMVRFLPDLEGPRETDVTLHSGDASLKKIKLVAQIKAQNLKLMTEEIVFKDVPLNKVVMRKAIVKNPLSYPLVFQIDDTEISQLLKIYPLSGTVQPLCQYAIYLFTRDITNCVVFSYTVKILTLRADYLLLPVRGNIVFPTIEITPTLVKLDKISAHTETSKEIRLKNVSLAPASVKFDLSETSSSYKIKESNKWDSKEVEELYLLPSQSASVHVYFSPEFVVSYDFYLPIIINGILGPPLLSDYISTKTEYYLTTMYNFCTYSKTPSSIPCCRIKSFATIPKFDISSTHINLSTNVLQTTAQYNWVIRNRQSVEDHIYIKTTDVRPPLDVTDKNRGFRLRYTYKLLPGEEVELTVSFTPKKMEFCTTKCIMPIFVNSEGPEKVYTTVYITATHEKPSIYITYTHVEELKSIPEQVRLNDYYIFYLRNLPLIPVGLCYNRLIHLKGHLPDCKLKIESDAGMFQFRERENSIKQISAHYYTTEVIMNSNLTKLSNCNGYWSISCTCGGLWTQRLTGTLESSLLTTYAFTGMYWRKLIKFDDNGKLMPPKLDASENCTNFFRTFPFMPHDGSRLAALLDNTVVAVESWTKTQIFYGETYYQIPSGINFVHFSPPPEICVQRKTRVCSIPFAQILITMVGPEMYSYLGITSKEMEDHEKVPYLLSVYTKGLELLRQRGASLAYVRPEYLLEYSNFLIYKETMYESQPPHPLTTAICNVWDFVNIGKASWTDVIIQIFKVFCMTRIRKLFDRRQAEACKSFEDFCVRDHVQKLPGIFCETESLLMSWLEFHFNKNRRTLWNANLPERTVVLFGEELKDGLVYAAVTASYCPYLIPFFINLYVDDVHSRNDMLHNNNVLIQCWERINYSFGLKSKDLVTTNSVGTLMLTAYLYEVLPSMYPTETLKFKDALGKTSAQKVVLSNNNDFPIAYKAMFIANHNECFQVSHEFIAIPPKKFRTIIVSYTAKFAKNVTSTLLFSGECTGYKYARNKCVSLEGTPDLTQPSSTIKFTLDIYDVKEVTFTVQSPYREECTYEIQQTYVDIAEPSELKNVIYHHRTLYVDCGSFIVTDEQLDCDAEGVGEISGIITIVNSIDISTWLFFRNRQIGDFSIKIVVISQDSKDNEVLTINVPKQSGRLMLEIPFKNQSFLRCMNKLLLKVTKDKEYQLWKRIIETQMGVDVLGRLYEFSIPPGVAMPVHCKSGTYKIVPNDKNVELPATVELPTECGNGSVLIPLKFKDRRLPLKDFRMILTAAKLLRKRFYLVKFIKEN